MSRIFLLNWNFSTGCCDVSRNSICAPDFSNDIPQLGKVRVAIRNAQARNSKTADQLYGVSYYSDILEVKELNFIKSYIAQLEVDLIKKSKYLEEEILKREEETSIIKRNLMDLRFDAKMVLSSSRSLMPHVGGSLVWQNDKDHHRCMNHTCLKVFDIFRRRYKNILFVTISNSNSFNLYF